MLSKQATERIRRKVARKREGESKIEGDVEPEVRPESTNRNAGPRFDRRRKSFRSLIKLRPRATRACETLVVPDCREPKTDKRLRSTRWGSNFVIRIMAMS